MSLRESCCPDLVPDEGERKEPSPHGSRFEASGGRRVNTDALEFPITHKEMLLLLQPLQSSLQRMESSLWELRKERPIAISPIGKSDSDNSKEIKLPRDADTAVESIDIPVTDMEREVSPASRNSEQVKDVKSKKSPGIPQGAVNLMQIYDIDKALAANKLKNEGQVPITSMGDRFVILIDNMSQCWSTIEEPQRNSFAYRLTSRGSFETCVQCVIILNAVLLAYSANWEIQHIGMNLPQFSGVLESCFLIFFLVELLLRLAAHGLYFFVNDEMLWNIFDFILVSISLVEVILAETSGSAGNNIGFIRMGRLLKLGRVMRALRLFRFLSSLSILLDSLRSSLFPLFWGLVLLTFLIYLFAITFIQGLAGYLNKDNVDPKVHREIEDKFGSLFKTCFSLYSSLVGADDWINYFDIVDKAGSMYGFLYVFFITFSSFAVFNLITGLLVEKAMASAAPNRSEQILQQRKAVIEQRSQFLEICRTMDTNGDERITLQEFKRWMQNPVMSSYLASTGLDIDDVELFFATVVAQRTTGRKTQTEGRVTFDEFVDGCMQMRGEASAIDMHRQLFESKVLHKEVKFVEEELTNRLQHLENLVSYGFNSLMLSNHRPRLPGEETSV